MSSLELTKHQVQSMEKVESLLNSFKMSEPLPSDVIVNLCGLNCDVELRSTVNRLRKCGVPVCSGHQGYWLARTDKEILETVHNLRGRALSMLSAASKMQSHLVNQDYMDEVLPQVTEMLKRL